MHEKKNKELLKKLAYHNKHKPITTIMSCNQYPISPNYPRINFTPISKALNVVCNLNTTWHLFAPRSARQKRVSEPTTIW